jgi:hypothetical protein
MKLVAHNNLLAITQLSIHEAIPNWVYKSIFINIFKNEYELSVVTDNDAVPVGLKTEPEWKYFKIEGPIPFQQTGILSSILTPLADNKIGIFALSTFDTDYILVKASQFDDAKKTLVSAGHQIK